MGNNRPLVCRPAPEKASGSKQTVHTMVMSALSDGSPLGGFQDLTVMTKEIPFVSISVYSKTKDGATVKAMGTAHNHLEQRGQAC